MFAYFLCYFHMGFTLAKKERISSAFYYGVTYLFRFHFYHL